MAYLAAIANVASILTAFFAAAAWFVYWRDKCAKQKRLEEYLKAVKASNASNKAHTVIHLMAKLGMTDAEILHASFSSRHVIHKVRKDDDTGLAAQLLFEYSDVAKPR